LNCCLCREIGQQRDAQIVKGGVFQCFAIVRGSPVLRCAGSLRLCSLQGERPLQCTCLVRQEPSASANESKGFRPFACPYVFCSPMKTIISILTPFANSMETPKLHSPPINQGIEMQAFNDTADVTHFIHGERVRGSGVRTQAIFNPATGERPRKLLLGEIADVDAAVASAMAAFPKWSNTPPIRRAGRCRAGCRG